MDAVTESSGQLLLLVEDERLVALEERRVLQAAGYTVEIATTGEASVDEFRTGRVFDLVLMDINLGAGMDGTEAAQKILELCDVPIMFLSSHTEPDIVHRTEGITSYGYIVKHTGETVLLASIRMAFRLHQARMQVKAQSLARQTMLEVSRDLAATHDLQAILQTASDRLSEFSELDTGAIYLVENDSLVLTATTPPLPEDFPDEYRRAPLLDHPHIGKAIQTAEPVFIGDVRAEPLTTAEQGVVESRALRSISYVPLVSQERVIGVFITGSTEQNVVLDRTTSDLCVTLANIAAVAAENALLMESVQVEAADT
jgi:DNA-binding response OmpR family regulator